MPVPIGPTPTLILYFFIVTVLHIITGLSALLLNSSDPRLARALVHESTRWP